MGEIVRTKTGRRQLRPIASRGWTKPKRARFLDLLAATANVTQAARTVNMSANGAFQLRRRDPAFAQLWAEALEDGYARLELEVLARALGQAESGDNPTDGDRADPEPLPFDLKAAEAALARRAKEQAGNARRDRAFRRATQDETDAELLRKLAAVEKRLGIVHAEDGPADAPFTSR